MLMSPIEVIGGIHHPGVSNCSLFFGLRASGNRASSLFYVYWRLRCCKKSENTYGRNYENFCHWQTDMTDEPGFTRTCLKENHFWHSKWTNSILIFSSLSLNNWCQQRKSQVRISSLNKKEKRLTMKFFKMFLHVWFCWEHGGALITLDHRSIVHRTMPQKPLPSAEELRTLLTFMGLIVDHLMPFQGQFIRKSFSTLNT